MTPMFAQSYTPQPGTPAPGGDAAWREALMAICREGQKVSPRGMDTVEFLHGNLVSVDMARAVVTSPERQLSHKFMAAEALWIVNGQNDLASLARFAPSYGRFSDDGVTLNGAYGPKILPQLPYVVNQLIKDRDTRQAVLTIWERSPTPSKDIPCTVMMSFSIRRDLLHLHVAMRSSDGWMGLPYDMFSFSTVALKVACEHNKELSYLASAGVAFRPVGLGTLTINATSSHIYLKDMNKVKKVLESADGPEVEPTPDDLVRAGDWTTLEYDLTALREGATPVRWKVVPW